MSNLIFPSFRTYELVMTSRLLVRIGSGITLMIISVVISWALLYESSPFFQDSLRPGWARYTWEIVNIPAFLATMISQTLATGILIMLAQWFLTGFFGLWIVQAIRGKNIKKTDRSGTDFK